MLRLPVFNQGSHTLANKQKKKFSVIRYQETVTCEAGCGSQ